MTDIELELDEQYLNDGPAECECCGRIYPESALAGDGLCGDCGIRVFGDAGEWGDGQ